MQSVWGEESNERRLIKIDWFVSFLGGIKINILYKITCWKCDTSFLSLSRFKPSMRLFICIYTRTYTYFVYTHFGSSILYPNLIVMTLYEYQDYDGMNITSLPLPLWPKQHRTTNKSHRCDPKTNIINIRKILIISLV